MNWKERGYPYFGNQITPGTNDGKEVGTSAPRMDGKDRLIALLEEKCEK